MRPSSCEQVTSGASTCRFLPSRLGYRKSKMASVQQSFSAVFITTLVLQSLLVPLCAAIVSIPIKRSSSLVSFTSSAGGNQGHHKIVRRDVSSVHSGAMKNNLNGLSGNGYYIDVDIGTPPQRMQVLIDTGSSNLAIACEPDPAVDQYFHRDNSSTYINLYTTIYVPYTEGEWRGVLGQDMLTVVSAKQFSARAPLACITESKKFYVNDAKWQGIMGLAYDGLSRPDSSVTPVWNAFMSADSNLPNVFSVQMCGSAFSHTKDKPLSEGSLTLGGVDQSLYKGEIFYAPIYKEWYYEVVLLDIAVNDETLYLDCKEYNFDKTIVDSGTTNVRLPIKVFNTLVTVIDATIKKKMPNMVPSSLFYSGEDIICFVDMSAPFNAFPVISFYLFQSEDKSFRLNLSPQHYLRPVAQVESAFNTDKSCVKFGFSSSTSGTVLGAVLMEAFYVVFDRESSRVGFAQTVCSLPDPRYPIVKVHVEGPFTPQSNSDDLCFAESID